ncbi:MAG: glycosyltransferase family 39 protein [Pseudomonadota bacterium]
MKTTLFDTHRISQLIYTSRVISTIMGALALIGLFMGVRLLFNNDGAALLAAFCLAVAQRFVFYCHTGNLEVASTFWFAWSFYWAVKAIMSGGRHHYILLGIFAGLLACTKDAYAVYAGGLGIGVCAGIIGIGRDGGKTWKEAIKGIVSLNVLTGAVVFWFVFALLNNILTDPIGYWDRMKYWSGSGPGVKPYTVYGQGLFPQLQLFISSCQDMYFGLGWPLFFSSLLGAGYGLVRCWWKACFCLLPLIVFYLIVITRIRFSEPRFYIVGYVGLVTLAGAGGMAWLNWKSIPVLVRVAAVVFVLSTTFLYGLGISLELASDSRTRVREWFLKNVHRNATIGSLLRVGHGPDLYDVGFERYAYPWNPPDVAGGMTYLHMLPQYIITSTIDWITGNDSEPRTFQKALTGGEVHYYRQVVMFSRQYMQPARTIFSFAGQPFDRFDHAPLCPPVVVFEKVTANGPQ